MGDNRGRHRAAENTGARRRERTAASSTKRKAQFVLATSGVTAAAVALGVAGPAFAVNPTQLRDGCKWGSTADQQRNIQTCTFFSQSLGRDVNVQIRASNQAAGGTEQAVYFLDGIGANNQTNTWANPDVGEVDAYSKGLNLVLPAGGAGEWATNWQSNPIQNGKSVPAPQWDTFLGKELPDYLNKNFTVQQRNNAIVGVSMSGGPAIITALNHPDVFAVARSFSGFYQTDNPGGYNLISYIQNTYAGISNGGTAMWGTPGQPGNTWAANDVSKRIAEAKKNGQTIIISVGNGIPPLKTVLALAAAGGIAGIVTIPVTIATGVAIELGSLASTTLLNAQAVAAGLPVRFKYNFGSHDFYSWAQSAPQDAAEIQAALAAAQAKSQTANALVSTAGPSTTTTPNTVLAKQVSATVSDTGVTSVTVPAKVATGSASSSTGTTGGTMASSTTGTATTGTTSPSTAPSTSTAPTSTASTGSTGSSSSTSAPSTSASTAPSTTASSTGSSSTESSTTGTTSTGTTSAGASSTGTSSTSTKTATAPAG
ncbi:MAG: alpha/beta hydrolase-fold protein [Gordonia paraffinivorans]